MNQTVLPIRTTASFVRLHSYDIIPHGRVLRHVTKSVPVESLTYRVDPGSHPHALDYTSWFLWPTFSFQIYPGNVLNTYVWHAVDHRTTRMVRQWFAADGVEPDLIESLAEQDLRTTVAEDVRLVESVQRGLESGGYRPAPLVIDPAGGVNSEHSIRVRCTSGWGRRWRSGGGGVLRSIPVG